MPADPKPLSEGVIDAIDNYTKACGSDLVPMHAWTRLTAAIAAMRDSVIEECAKVCDEYEAEPIYEDRHVYRSDAACYLAERLRALRRPVAP